MNRPFYRALYDRLEAGGSAGLVTVLSGEWEGRDLTAQKLLVIEGERLPLDPPFWSGAGRAF